jgi:ribose transport system ATP-binding protein
MSQNPLLSASSSLLEIRGLEKSFASNRVLKGIDLSVRAGEVHAIMGGNGAGKSTLIKCLSGYWRPDAGSIQIAGEPFVAGDGRIAFVQQDLGLISSMSVVENVCMGVGFRTGRFGNIRWREETARVSGILTALGHPDIDPRAEVRTLNTAERTITAIARATQGLRDGAKMLVLDEPTAALPADETTKLFRTLESLRESGVGMIYVSHHLSEVLAISDRISVLRDGQVMATLDKSETDEASLIELMLGRPVTRMRRKSAPGSTSPTLGPAVLELQQVDGPTTRDIDLQIRAGEIVGLVGLQGAGCTEVARLLFGAAKTTAGRILLDGHEVVFQHPRDAMKAGIGMVTEDRNTDGSFPSLSVMENVSITDVRRFFRRGWLSMRKERQEIRRLVADFDVVPKDETVQFSTLSGGNQQKALLSKWLRLSPRLLICDQPDVGVDVGALATIYRSMRDAAADGAGVLIISNQYDHLEELCDRVVVLRDGRVAAQLHNDDVTEHEISRLVVGATLSAKEDVQ